jgi:HlyD family secretion protein
MTPQRRWSLAGAAAAAVAALAWAFAPRPVAVEVATVTTGRFEQFIEEDGRTRLRDRFVVSAPLGGRLLRPALREGDAVVAGDVLARIVPAASPLLDDRSARESLTRVAGAQAQRAAADARLARAAVAVEQARAELRRSETLAGEGFLSPTRLETARLALQGYEREADAARQERQVAEQALQQARVAAGIPGGGGTDRPGGGGPDRPTGAGPDSLVRAPVAGQVLRVLHPSEGPVAAGTPLFELGDLGSLEVVAELLTTDAPRAAPGTPVRIDRWGGTPDLQGAVVRVEPAAFTKVSALGVEEQRVLVVIALTSPRTDWQALGDGYRVAVRLQVQAVDGARQVPSSAVFPVPSGHAVFVIDGGRARQTAVTVGGRQGAVTWLKDGPPEGTEVIVYPPASVRDGLRVRRTAAAG